MFRCFISLSMACALEFLAARLVAAAAAACALEFLAARLVAAELHEHAHAVVARLLGHKPEVHYRMCVEE